MPRFSPSVFYTSRHKTVNLPFSTYADLKKRIRDHIALSDEGEVFVTRYRRGEWGEWFEYWTLKNGKPVIDREGWM